MASRLRRTHSSKEVLPNVRRAKQLAERYGYDVSNPSEYLDPAPDDFNDLLSQIK